MKNWLPFVFGPGVRHRERAAHDGQLERALLVVERVPGAARPVAARATALDHEVRDHAVEAEPVVDSRLPASLVKFATVSGASSSSSSTRIAPRLVCNVAWLMTSSLSVEISRPGIVQARSSDLDRPILGAMLRG